MEYDGKRDASQRDRGQRTGGPRGAAADCGPTSKTNGG
jgi:hypothetical protein